MWWMRIRFQAIFRLWPTTARFCCQPHVMSWLQSSWNRSWTNGLFVVVGEALLDRVGDRDEHVGVLLLAGGQPGVDQVGRDVVADRVPVLARPVAPQRVALAVERDRVEVRPVAAVLGVVEEPLEERDRRVDVVVDPLVAGDPEDLRRARPGRRSARRPGWPGSRRRTPRRGSSSRSARSISMA